jgi:DNA-binding transcriptional regulator YdaS (Cro superfamily)
LRNAKEEMDLKTYIRAAPGNGQTLAAGLGIKPSFLSQLAHGIRKVTPKRAVQIEKLTHGAVTRKDLRADDWLEIWPELPPDWDGTTERRSGTDRRTAVKTSKPRKQPKG